MLAIPCSRILLVQGGVYCLPCGGHALGFLPTYLTSFPRRQVLSIVGIELPTTSFGKWVPLHYHPVIPGHLGPTRLQRGSRCFHHRPGGFWDNIGRDWTSVYQSENRLACFDGETTVSRPWTKEFGPMVIFRFIWPLDESQEPSQDACSHLPLVCV